MSDILNPSTGFNLQVQETTEMPGDGIFLVENDLAETAKEGYSIKITEYLINVSSSTPAGIFMAIQTLRQLLPAQIEAKTTQEGPWEIATGSISDHPQYGYRGVMLDVARHFFTVDEVKRLIDLIALCKINSLHLHLSDDQGWRIEIKSWPKLTEHGGSLEVGGTPGGFYTQEDYTAIVEYAASRYITIIPEIDMPGHTEAALASYPELSCDGKFRELYTGTEVGFSTLCTDKAITYQFVDDVVREIAAISPGPYFHIGGDESYVTAMEDYVFFVDSIQQIVTKYGKK